MVVLDDFFFEDEDSLVRISLCIPILAAESPVVTQSRTRMLQLAIEFQTFSVHAESQFECPLQSEEFARTPAKI